MGNPKLLFNFLLLFAAAMPLFATTKPVDPIVGRWFWGENYTVIFYADGTCIVENDGTKGKWEYLKNPEIERKYGLTWDQGRLLNRMTIAQDGKSAQVLDQIKEKKFKARKSAE